MDLDVFYIFGVVLCAASFGLALIRIGQTPIVGYIIAGIILGPSCMKFIQNEKFIEALADYGIIFLMFAIGLNISFEKIKNFWKQGIGTIVIGGLASGIIFAGIGYIFNWSFEFICIATFCSVPSSTAVTIKSLEKIKNTNDIIRGATVGILILQDIIALLLIIAIKMLAGIEIDKSGILKLVVTGTIFFAIAVFISFNKRYWYSFLKYLKDQTDILAIITVTFCLGGAALSSYFGLSAAFGSFLAGLVLGSSALKEELQKSTAIIEELLLMVFFLSIGLFFNLSYVCANIWLLLISVLLIALVKTFLNIAILRFFKIELREAFISGVLLGHLGEFAFVIIGEGVKDGLINAEGRSFLITITALSLFFSPFWLVIAERCRKITEKITIDSTIQMLVLTLRKERIITKKTYIFLRTLVISLYILFFRRKERDDSK